MHDLSVVCLYTATLSSTKADGQPESRKSGGLLEWIGCLVWIGLVMRIASHAWRCTLNLRQTCGCISYSLSLSLCFNSALCSICTCFECNDAHLVCCFWL